MEPRHAHRSRRTRGDRGAVLAEYGLMLAAFAAALLAVAATVTDGARAVVSGVADDIGTEDDAHRYIDDASDSGGGGGDGDGASTTTSTTTASTPSTTTPPPPSTTTTTAPPDDDDQPGNPSSGSRWDEDDVDTDSETVYRCTRRAWWGGCREYEHVTRWSVSAPVAIYKSDGQRLNDRHINVTVEVERFVDGAWQTVETVTKATNDGRVAVGLEGLDPDEVSKVRFSVVSVSGSSRWDGQTPYITVDAP